MARDVVGDRATEEEIGQRPLWQEPGAAGVGERLRLLELIEENVTDFAIFTMDTSGKVTIWGTGAERILGYTEADVIGQDLSRIFTPEDRERGADRREMEDARETGHAVDERWHLRKDGSRFWASGILTALREQDTGRLMGFAKILRDATVQRLGMEALQQVSLEREQILESLSDAFYAVDEEFRFTYVNRRAEEFWGVPRNALLGNQIWTVFPQVVGTHSQAMHLRAMKERQPVNYETLSPIIARWVEVNLSPKEGGGLSVYFRDIDERKATEERLQAALNASGVGTYRWNVRTDALYVDESFCRLFGAEGLPVDTLQAFLALVHEDDRQGVIDKCRQSAELGEDFDFEYRIVRPDGGIRWVYDRGKAIPGADDQPLYVTGACVDITLRRHDEERIHSLNTRLQLAMTETHHRIKNNLQVAAALVEMQSNTNEDYVPLADMKRIGQHLRSMAAIHDILTQESKGDGDLSTISAMSLLHKLLPLIQRTVGGRQLRIDLADALLPVRYGTSLAIMINEIVSNAVKHGQGAVDLALTSEGNIATLRVCDSGPGFPPNFNPEKAANTGLELIQNLSRWDLQGKASFENRPEGGACVIVRFPLPKT